jgi:rubrerythrin
MSKVREAFYSLSDEEYYSMQGMDTAAEYIKELKENNKEMLECLLDCYNDMKNDCSDCSKCVAHYAIWQFIERKVKKITGKSIEEVFKDEYYNCPNCGCGFYVEDKNKRICLYCPCQWDIVTGKPIEEALSEHK